jgi:hypothetical protein
MLMLVMEERGGQDAEKETYPCCHRQKPLCIVHVRGGNMAKPLVRKKVMEKERRSL